MEMILTILTNDNWLKWNRSLDQMNKMDSVTFDEDFEQSFL